jgi:hypothetical protein
MFGVTGIGELLLLRRMASSELQSTAPKAKGPASRSKSFESRPFGEDVKAGRLLNADADSKKKESSIGGEEGGELSSDSILTIDSVGKSKRSLGSHIGSIMYVLFCGERFGFCVKGLGMLADGYDLQLSSKMNLTLRC